MRVSLLAWAIFALFGNTAAGLSGWFESSLVFSEPVRLALWGVTLIAFSRSLKSRTAVSSAVPQPAESSADLEGAIETHLARTA